MKQLFLTIILVSLISCTKKNSQDISDDVSYKEYLVTSIITEKDLIHLPLKTTSFPSMSSNSFDYSDKYQWAMHYEFKKEKGYVDSIKTSLVPRFIYQSNDSSLIALIPEYKIYNRMDSLKDYFPIPYFVENELFSPFPPTSSVYSSNNISGLANGFDIYLLETVPNVSNETLKGIDFLPKEWRHGESRGICIKESDGTIIYWVLKW